MFLPKNGQIFCLVIGFENWVIGSVVDLDFLFIFVVSKNQCPIGFRFLQT
jgi:hypothetical protein